MSNGGVMDNDYVLKTTLAMLKREARIKQAELDMFRATIQIIENNLHASVHLDQVDTQGVMQLIGVSKTTLTRYISGKVPKGKPPFPKAVSRRDGKKWYNAVDIRNWDNTKLN